MKKETRMKKLVERLQNSLIDGFSSILEGMGPVQFVAGCKCTYTYRPETKDIHVETDIMQKEFEETKRPGEETSKAISKFLFETIMEFERKAPCMVVSSALLYSKFNNEMDFEISIRE